MRTQFNFHGWIFVHHSNNSYSEGSEYNLESDEEHTPQQKKKNKPKNAKRKDKRMKANDKSELDMHGIMTLAGKNSNTSKTIDAMSELEQSELVVKAKHSLQSAAKRTIRDEAMKVNQ